MPVVWGSWNALYSGLNILERFGTLGDRLLNLSLFRDDDVQVAGHAM